MVTTKTNEPIRHSYSKTSEYKKCAHRDYLGRERNWEPARPNVHLAVGLAHHKGMTAIWKEGCSGNGRSMDAAIEAGHAAFWKEWERCSMPMGQELLTKAPEMKAKTPWTAEKVLSAYAVRRWEWMSRLKLVGSEETFEVHLFTKEDGVEVWYIGVVDKVVEDEYGIHPFEHKTSSLYATKGGFRPTLLKSFAPNSQIEGYSWWGRQKYGEKLAQIYIDLSLYHKEHRAFLIVPMAPADEVIDAWVERQTAWSRRMIASRESYRDGSMHPNLAFLRNEESCVDKFGMCKFYDLCRYNPDLEEIKEIPDGFEPRRQWNMQEEAT